MEGVSYKRLVLFCTWGWARIESGGLRSREIADLTATATHSLPARSPRCRRVSSRGRGLLGFAAQSRHIANDTNVSELAPMTALRHDGWTRYFSWQVIGVIATAPCRLVSARYWPNRRQLSKPRPKALCNQRWARSDSVSLSQTKHSFHFKVRFYSDFQIRFPVRGFCRT